MRPLGGKIARQSERIRGGKGVVISGLDSSKFDCNDALKCKSLVFERHPSFPTRLLKRLM